MTKIFRKIFGLLLILAAIMGFLLSIIGMISINHYKPLFTANLINNLETINSSLETTAQGLIETQNSLNTSLVAVISLQNTINTTANTINASEPMLDTLIIMMDEELPDTIQATQTSFETAQASAKVIDSVLRALSFLPGISYNPKTPLHEALADVSMSLDGIPESLTGMTDSIEDTRHNLQIIQVDLILMKDTIRQIENSLSSYEEILEQYQTSLSSFKKQISDLQKKIPDILNTASWISYSFLIWMAIAQIGLMTQGWELLVGEKSASPEAKKEKSDEQ